MIDKELHASVSIAIFAFGSGRKLGHVGHGPVDDPSHRAYLDAPLALHLFRSLAPAADVDSESNAERGHAGGNQRCWEKTKRDHWFSYSSYYCSTKTLVRKPELRNAGFALDPLPIRGQNHLFQREK